MTDEFAPRKDRAAAWFRDLRDQIVAAFEALEAKAGGSHQFEVTPTTRETGGKLHGKRLPELLKNGTLAQAFDLEFSPENSRFMLCGNPAMVKDTFQALLDMGFAMHRNRVPGQIMMENGF